MYLQNAPSLRAELQLQLQLWLLNRFFNLFSSLVSGAYRYSWFSGCIYSRHISLVMVTFLALLSALKIMFTNFCSLLYNSVNFENKYFEKLNFYLI